MKHNETNETSIWQPSARNSDERYNPDRASSVECDMMTSIHGNPIPLKFAPLVAKIMGQQTTNPPGLVGLLASCLTARFIWHQPNGVSFTLKPSNGWWKINPGISATYPAEQATLRRKSAPATIF